MVQKLSTKSNLMVFYHLKIASLPKLKASLLAKTTAIEFSVFLTLEKESGLTI